MSFNIFFVPFLFLRSFQHSNFHVVQTTHKKPNDTRYLFVGFVDCFFFFKKRSLFLCPQINITKITNSVNLDTVFVHAWIQSWILVDDLIFLCFVGLCCLHLIDIPHLRHNVFFLLIFQFGKKHKR